MIAFPSWDPKEGDAILEALTNPMLGIMGSFSAGDDVRCYTKAALVSH